MKNRFKAIGILGGMGPGASVYMHRLLVELAAKKFGARDGDEFPEIIHDSIPISDFVSSEKKQRKALVMLSERVERLNNLNMVSFFGVACNTAHILLPSLQKKTSIPFVSMIEEVANFMPENIKTVGLLATPVTIRSSIYQLALTKRNKKILIPTNTQLRLIEPVIRNVIAGKLLKSDSATLVRIAISFQKKGAQGIILGCTELPLVFPIKFNLPVFNSVEILSMALLRKYYQGNTIQR